MTPHYTKAGNFFISGVMLIVSLGVAFGLGEGLLRWCGYAGAPNSQIANTLRVDDPILNWRFAPNSNVQDGKLTYRYNSKGFRDSEHEVGKAAGITRLVVVGDSVTEGAGVQFEEIFSTRLQGLLGSTQEVISLGMSGLNSPQESHLLEVEGLRYEPDVVILNFVLNDCSFFTERDAAMKFTEGKDSTIGILGGVNIDPRVKRLIKSSAFIYFVKARIEHLVGLLNSKNEGGYYTRLWNSTKCQERLTSGFNHLAELQHQNQFQVHVVIWPLLVEFKPYEFCWVHERIYKEAMQRGFEVHDLLEAYRPVSYRKLQVTSEDNVHPNGLGHRLAAESYSAWRLRKGDSGTTTSRVCSAL